MRQQHRIRIEWASAAQWTHNIWLAFAYSSRPPRRSAVWTKESSWFEIMVHEKANWRSVDVDDRCLHLHNDFSRSNRIFACTQLEFQRWMSTIYNSHMYFVKQTFWVIFVFVFVVPLLFAVPYLFLIQWVWMSMDVYIWMKIMVVYSTVSAALLYAFDIQLVTILWNFCTTSMI